MQAWLDYLGSGSKGGVGLVCEYSSTAGLAGLPWTELLMDLPSCSCNGGAGCTDSERVRPRQTLDVSTGKARKSGSQGGHREGALEVLLSDDLFACERRCLRGFEGIVDYLPMAKPVHLTTWRHALTVVFVDHSGGSA